MLTSKLTLMLFTWVMALLVSISLRVVGIIHPQPFSINHFLVWVLLFGPSFAFLIYFWVRRSFSLNSSI
ncbi:hypothetical protein [Prochlorococcus marinus]|uniref:hypothetical protein n=1 Tax=Prochlorococcus marinus TaxID=1219 RepID=UPI0039AF59E6